MEDFEMLKNRPGDENLPRWLCMIRWDISECRHLHALEKLDDKNLLRHPSEYAPRAGAFFIEANDRRGPYWPERMELRTREEMIEAFRRSVYPIWRPIWERLDKAFLLLPGDPGYLSEMAALHEADAEIFRAALAGGWLDQLMAGTFGRSPGAVGGGYYRRRKLPPTPAAPERDSGQDLPEFAQVGA
jgi:hypothetical protein